MRAEDFKGGAPGQIVPTEAGDGVAFVPDPLPPRGFQPNFALWKVLSEADVGLATLEGLAQTLPAPQMFLRPFLFKEAVDSSRIEGTQTTFEELLAFEAATARAKESADPDTQVTANYITALDYGMQLIRDLPFSRRLMTEVHARLMRGYNEYRSRPGDIRTGQVVIGAPNAKPETARLVPPPRTYVENLISDLERFWNDANEMPLLLRVALAHYQFETIHPFWDGNGRVGRLLISLMITSEGRLTYPMLHLSGYFEARRDEYYSRMLGVSQHNAWDDWVTFFLRGVTAQAKGACYRIRGFQGLRDEYVRRITSKKRSAASDLVLLDKVLEHLVVSGPSVREWLGVSPPSAQDAIGRFVGHGILQRLPLESKTHYYEAPEAIRIISGGP